MSSSAGLRCSLAPGQQLGQLLCADPKGMLVSRTHRKFCPTAADLWSIMAFLQPQPDHHIQIISQQLLKSPIPDNVLAPPEILRISSRRAHMPSRMTYLALSTGFNGLCSPLLESSIFFPQKQHGQVYQSNNLITNSGSSFILCCYDRTAWKSPGRKWFVWLTISGYSQYWREFNAGTQQMVTAHPPSQKRGCGLFAAQPDLSTISWSRSPWLGNCDFHCGLGSYQLSTDNPPKTHPQANLI